MTNLRRKCFDRAPRAECLQWTSDVGCQHRFDVHTVENWSSREARELLSVLNVEGICPEIECLHDHCPAMGRPDNLSCIDFHMATARPKEQDNWVQTDG